MPFRPACYPCPWMSDVFLAVTIDCECDKGRGWRAKDPLRFDGVREGVGKRLAPLFRSFSAKATYLLSPEIFSDPSSVELFGEQAGAAELGTHLHGEYAEPGATRPGVTLEFQRDYPPEVELAKLTWLTEAFRSAFGFRPRSFRAGRFGVGPASVGFLESLGYAVDSSVTPHVSWERAGAPGLNFRDSPTQPYHPSRVSPGEPGESPLVEVPVTICARRFSGVPFIGALVRTLLEPRWLRPTHLGADALTAVAQDALHDARRALEARGESRRPLVLNAMFHNTEVIADASPYARTEPEAQTILARVGGLLEFAARESIRVVGLSDIAEMCA
jgi:hypothetical protein